MTERVTISHVGHRGDGVVPGPTGPLYVPYALPGEIVTVEPVPGHPERRHVLRVETESPQRIVPVCPHFGVCGGCAMQHWDSEHYREWKRDLAVQALAQVGLAAEVGALVDAHGAGRRRVVLHARRSGQDVLHVGFAAPRAHHIVAIDRCPILAPALAPAIAIAWRLAEALQPLRKPLDIHITASEAGLDVDLRGSGPLTPSLQMALAQIATEQHLARVTRHGELVVQSALPTIRMGRAQVPLPPGAFLQATATGEETLARLVLAHASDGRHVADLFCGVGPFALRLAESARVTAIDSDAAAVAALQRAVANTSGLKPVSASVRDLFRRPLLPEELSAFDVVVFDPPRAGAETQARQLAASRVPRVVAVSCNAATFARDARIMVDGGYRLATVTPVDQFRYSAHVELVVLFVR